MATERPKATQSEIDSILNHYNRGKDFLKECWKICAKNNLILPYKLYFDLDDEYYTESDSCKELKKDGVKWKWLPNDILQILPTMANPYLEHPLDRISDIPLEEENIIEDDNSNEQYEETETIEDTNENENDVDEEKSWEEEIIDKINNGISLSGTTFSNSGVRSIASGSTNGTISVNTNGTSANVAVKGLGSAAYTASTSYAKASHTHTGAQVTMSGYSTISGGSITTSDTVNTAINKLEDMLIWHEA